MAGLMGKSLERTRKLIKPRVLKVKRKKKHLSLPSFIRPLHIAEGKGTRQISSQGCWDDGNGLDRDRIKCSRHGYSTKVEAEGDVIGIAMATAEDTKG